MPVRAASIELVPRPQTVLTWCMRDADAMAVICDPTLLLTRRGQDWLNRVVTHECAEHVRVSRAFIEGSDQTRWAPSGMFGLSQRGPAWSPDSVPVRLVDYRDAGIDRVMERLIERRHYAVADVWAGLQQGHLVAARRPRVIDELVAAGVELRVTSDGAHDARDLWPQIPHDLSGALSRRVRFFCRMAAADIPPRQLRVVDLGWGVRR
jgi:hypothetical protein